MVGSGSLVPGDDAAGFLVPDWGEDVPLEPYLANCPEDATTRGTFFLHVYDLVSREMKNVPDVLFDGIPRRRWLPFHAYPLREFMRLAHNGARLAYPRLSSSNGLRHIGWMSYPSFAATMAGRVVLFAFGSTLDDVMRAAPRAYSVALPGSTVQTKELAPQRWLFEMRNVPSFVQSYQFGVVEGAILAFSKTPRILTRRTDRLGDADFDVSWE